MRFNILILLCLYSSLINADWTGVAIEFADSESDWKFDSGVRKARGTELSFRIEEKIDTGLRIGASFGLINLRVDSSVSNSSNGFDVQFLSFYLRQPFQINETFALFTGMNYRLHTGTDDDGTNQADISWSEIEFHFGTSLKLSNIRISPLVIYRAVDGDIDSDNGTEDFKLDDPVSAGIRFDIFTDPTAFVRLEFQSGNRRGLFLSFAREY